MKVRGEQYRRLLAGYLRAQRGRVLLLAALLVGTIGLQLLNPQIVRYFIDTATTGAADGAGGAGSQLVGAALLFLGVALAQELVAVLATYVSENVAWTATNALRRDLAVHCLRLDMSFHNARTPGELIERIDGDVTTLANFFSQFVIRVLGNALLLVGILLLLFREDWRVGLALTGLAAIGLVLLYSLSGLARPHWVAGRQASADLAGFLEERLAGTEDIRANGAVAYKMRSLYELMRRLTQRYRSARVVGHFAGVIGWSLSEIGLAVGLALGAYLFIQGAFTIGTVYLISFYAGMLATPLRRITDEIQDLQKSAASIARVEELYRTPITIQDGPGVAWPPGALSVEFDRVSFAYFTDSTVLRELSFRLEPGTVVGVLGRTGSGKTTITRLLLRLYDPTAGAIRLGDVDIRAARLSELRGRIGMVTQEVQLFHGTVRDNLTLFDRSITDERILDGIEELGLLPWYGTLPKGLDTELGGAGGLSAGEAQLLAFTRVFLRDPSVVILDEASSRLDPATERLIERAVSSLLRGRTGLIVAHRLGTVQRADGIMILEGGRICEYGAREQLALNPSSRFYRLLQTGLEETEGALEEVPA